MNAKLNLAKTYRSLKRLTTRWRLFEAALAIQPERHDARFSLGNACGNWGR